MVEPVVFDPESGVVRLLDQTRLPRTVDYVECSDAAQVARSIAGMVVRGAPAIGIAAACGLAVEAGTAARRGELPNAALARLHRAGRLLVSARPTAVSLPWAVTRVLSAVDRCARDGADTPRMAAVAVEEAVSVIREDREANVRIGELGATLLGDDAVVLTHCNAGALACGAFGTALGVVRAAAASGRKVRVYACETRPYLQGARLTAWELRQDGIPVTLIVDSAAGSLLARRRVDAVLVGADRIAANGDTANKVGTYTLAVLAEAHGVPFLVAAPWSTVDPETPSGEAIPIEERDPAEITSFAGEPVAPAGVDAWNPSFDVTPARLISAIITDRGILRPPYNLSASVNVPVGDKAAAGGGGCAGRGVGGP